jgi:hypothetical protein
MRVRTKTKARAGVSKDVDKDEGKSKGEGKSEMTVRANNDDWGSKDGENEGEADRTIRKQCRE